MKDYNQVSDGNLYDFCKENNIETIVAIDGGMFGRIIQYFIVDGQLRKCSAYQSNGFSSNHTCNFTSYEVAEWKELRYNNEQDFRRKAFESIASSIEGLGGNLTYLMHKLNEFDPNGEYARFNDPKQAIRSNIVQLRHLIDSLEAKYETLEYNSKGEE